MWTTFLEKKDVVLQPAQEDSYRKNLMLNLLIRLDQNGTQTEAAENKSEGTNLRNIFNKQLAGYLTVKSHP